MGDRNTRQFLADTLRELATAGVPVWVFGGWAEELFGLRPPGPHVDIDLLYPAVDFSALEDFLQARDDLEEIEGKRFSHKRAYRQHGILIEIFLLRPDPAGYVTHFFGVHLFRWPVDTLSATASLLGGSVPVASPAALTLYRERHGAVEEAYREYANSIIPPPPAQSAGLGPPHH